MKLVIAEKPMLARDIARAMCGKAVSETARLPIWGNGYCVCACAGHLMELVDPKFYDERYEKWNVEDLPITFDNWRKEPSEGKQELVDSIGELLEQADTVINAGDPDDEGQLIVDEVLEYLGWQGKTLRVFVNDNIEKNIVRAFENLKENSECEATGRAAYGRQMADMCFGVNETRLATKCLGKLLSVGRVQTPTLGLIVQRDLAIEGHSQRKFYELKFESEFKAKNGQIFEGVLKFEPSKSLLGDEKHIFEVSTLENIKRGLEGVSMPITLKSTKKLENPPLPFNLTVLQSEMSKRFKYSAKKTLDLTQALRDKYKAITYNRSDCQYLKEEHFANAKNVMDFACKNLGRSWDLDFSIKSSCFNDKNVSAHHGIIPQEVCVDTSQMTKDELNVYQAIVERFAAQFMEAAEYEVVSGVAEAAESKLEYKFKTLVKAGWKVQLKNLDDDKKDDNKGGAVPAGEYSALLEHGNIVEKTTTPPKRYTEGTLIKDMSCISKYVKDAQIKEILKRKDDGKKGENGGIGTTATRAAIIEKLKERGYVEEQKGKLISTKIARDFYALLPEAIKSADVTAKWWLIQQDIEDGKADVNAIQRSVVEVFNSHKGTAYAGKSVDGGRTVVGKCPKCGKNVVAGKGSFQCESNKWVKDASTGAWSCAEGCQFSLIGFGGKRFTQKQVEGLLAGKTVALRGCKSKKTGKTYDCKLKMKDDGSLEPIFGGGGKKVKRR